MAWRGSGGEPVRTPWGLYSCFQSAPAVGLSHLTSPTCFPLISPPPPALLSPPLHSMDWHAHIHLTAWRLVCLIDLCSVFGNIKWDCSTVHKQDTIQYFIFSWFSLAMQHSKFLTGFSSCLGLRWPQTTILSGLPTPVFSGPVFLSFPKSPTRRECQNSVCLLALRNLASLWVIFLFQTKHRAYFYASKGIWKCFSNQKKFSSTWFCTILNEINLNNL